MPSTRSVSWTLRFATTCLCLLAGPSAAAANLDDRLIVKFRQDGAASALESGARLDRLVADTGVALEYIRPLALGAHLVRVPPEAASQARADTVERIAGHPSVQYAQRNRVLRPARTPNDPEFFRQQHLRTDPDAIDAVSAWDVTTGSPSVIVAVVDSGIRPNPDLNGRTVPGYDFVSDPKEGNDGDGRDPDASEPDYLIPPWPENWLCGGGNFHGTTVAGFVGATGDNGLFLAGLDWNARIQPIRVLGNCGLADEVDVAEAIAWAGGLAVPGIPGNPLPAHVINASIGILDPPAVFPQPEHGSSQYVLDVICEVLRLGVTRAVVIAAGNGKIELKRSGEDSTCTGMIVVGATAPGGNKADYSNFGSRIDISAPGGDLHKLGVGLPHLSGGWIDFNASGTSFSAPQVSGTIALMLSVAPGLTAREVRELLRASTKPFPEASDCTPATCGTGILDAGGAVRAALAFTGKEAQVRVVEFYHAVLDHYFITWVPAEIALLDDGTTIKGWSRTGQSWKVLTPGLAGSPVCRIYIPPLSGDGHFFGRDSVECDGTMQKRPEFILEDRKFFVVYSTQSGDCAPGTVPVYRVFSNRPDANHRYTTERVIRDAMLAQGWLAEGDGPDTVAMCAPQ